MSVAQHSWGRHRRRSPRLPNGSSRSADCLIRRKKKIPVVDVRSFAFVLYQICLFCDNHTNDIFKFCSSILLEFFLSKRWWRHRPLILALAGQRQVDLCDLKASLAFRARPGKPGLHREILSQNFFLYPLLSLQL